MGCAMARSPRSSLAALPPPSAPYERFRAGIQQSLGYDLVEEGDRFVLSFAPWFAESLCPHREPRLRLLFRKRADQVVLEQFLVEDDDGESRPLNIDAARDALQAWLDCVCG